MRYRAALVVALAVALVLVTGRAATAVVAPGLSFSPNPVNLAPGGTTLIDLRLTGGQDIGGYEVDLAFDPAIVAIDAVERIVGSAGQPSPNRPWYSLPLSVDPNVTYTVLGPGRITFGAYSTADGNPPGLTGDLTLARLHVRALQAGGSALHLERALVVNTAAQASAPNLTDGQVIVGATPTATVTHTPTRTATPTATRTATPTPSGTPPPGAQPLSGRVMLQGRATHAGSLVAAGAVNTATQGDGSFSLSLPPGSYTVAASRPKYLSRQTSVTLGAGGALLPPTTLLGGDATGDNRVNLSDLVIVGANYGTQPPGDARADLNEDGAVNLFDLVLVGGSYDRVGPLGWTAAKDTPLGSAADLGLAAPFKRASHPRALIDVPADIKAGETFDAVLRVTGAKGLAGIDAALRYDPAALEVVAVGPGNLFDPRLSFVARQAVDDKRGVALYTAVSLSPLGATVDQGDALRVTFRARADGPPVVTLEAAQLAARP